MAASLSPAQLAQSYGYALAFMKSDPSLYGLFQKAVKKGYDASQFSAALLDTPWWKKHSATYRQNIALKYTDPSEYNSRLSQSTATVQDAAAALGANLSPEDLKMLSEHFNDLGWSDAQLKNTLAAYVGANSSGLYTGSSGDALAQLKQTAWRNGVTYSDSSYQGMVHNIALGNSTVEDYQTKMRGMASSLAPGLSEQLKGGQDLYDLAQPYLNAMSTTLELGPGNVDLFDPTIRAALNTKDSTTGKIGTQSIGEFEQSLRGDPRWMKTSNARDTFTSTAHNILTSFGLVS